MELSCLQEVRRSIISLPSRLLFTFPCCKIKQHGKRKRLSHASPSESWFFFLDLRHFPCSLKEFRPLCLQFWTRPSLFCFPQCPLFSGKSYCTHCTSVFSLWDVGDVGQEMAKLTVQYLRERNLYWAFHPEERPSLVEAVVFIIWPCLLRVALHFGPTFTQVVFMKSKSWFCVQFCNSIEVTFWSFCLH